MHFWDWDQCQERESAAVRSVRSGPQDAPAAEDRSGPSIGRDSLPLGLFSRPKTYAQGFGRFARRADGRLGTC